MVEAHAPCQQDSEDQPNPRRGKKSASGAPEERDLHEGNEL
jgi:hypothetical protein